MEILQKTRPSINDDSGVARAGAGPVEEPGRCPAVILNKTSRFRLPDLGRFSRGFPGNGLGTFPSDFLHPGCADSTPVPTRPFDRLRDASPTRMASPFAPGFARSCVWRQLLAVNGQPVVAGLVLCRRPILPGDRVQKVPSPFPPRSGCLNIEMIFDITIPNRPYSASRHRVHIHAHPLHSHTFESVRALRRRDGRRRNFVHHPRAPLDFGFRLLTKWTCARGDLPRKQLVISALTHRRLPTPRR